MAWNVLILFFIFAFAGTVDSKYLGVPNAIKDYEVISDSQCKSCAQVNWRAYESDTVSFKVEFVPVHDGESFFGFENRSIEEHTMKNFGIRSMQREFGTQVKGLKLNETYIVRVFAFNERGQSPPSPAVIFSLDPNPVPVMYRHFYSIAPQNIKLDPYSENGTKVSWDEVRYRENLTRTMSPIEYTIRYGDQDKNTSLWKELKTNNTWITLDDLENGREYSAYVIAREENLTSYRSYTFPIMVGEDMTGLPEAVITIEPADKNGVFAPGDSMSFKCSIPPNTVPFVGAVIKSGQLLMDFAMTTNGYNSPVTLLTTAKKDVETARCEVFGGEKGTRTTYISWKVKENVLDDERLQKKLVGADETLTGFK